MEITQERQRNTNNGIWTVASDEAAWLGIPVSSELVVGNVQPSIRSALIDQKARRMLEFHSNLDRRLTRAYRGFRFLMMKWVLLSEIQNRVKRAFDLLISISSLPFLFPIMLITAIAIKLDTPGPVFFKQIRVGKWGKTFYCYKFRSMIVDAEARKAELMIHNEADEVVFKMKHDPRVTRVGGIIRKFSIDELPQVINVIKGDMSLVGPRPPVPVEVEYYKFDQFRRLETVPGLTGLQQISGRSELSFKRWVELDVEYIKEQSLKKDIEIILKTIPTVITGRGAY